MKIVAAQKMPDRHFYLLRHHILCYIKFLLFCSLAPDEIKILCRKNKGVSLEEFVNPLDFNFPESHILLVHSTLPNCRFRQSEKRKNTLSQMRLRSVFKMRMSILNTATTEQMGQGIFSFFVYIKSTESNLNCGF